MTGRRAALGALTTVLVVAALIAVAVSTSGSTSMKWANRAPRALRGEGAVVAVSPNKTAASKPAAKTDDSTKPKQSPSPPAAKPLQQPELAQGQQQPGALPPAAKLPQAQEQPPAKPQLQPQQPAKPREVAAPAEAGKSQAAHSAAHSAAKGATPAPSLGGKKADAAASAGEGVRSSEEKDPDVSGFHRGVNAGCFAMRGGKLLVVRQRSGAWSLPGGTGERGESSRRTAARETYEETGYRVSAGSLLTVWHNGFRIYRCSVHGRSSGHKDHHEVSGFGWKSAGEINRMRWRFPGQAKRYSRWMR